MMTPLTIIPNLDAAQLPGVNDAAAAQRLLHGRIAAVGILPGGTSNGLASVALTIELPDGRTVLGETTLALFANGARALLASPIAEAEGHAR
jgi:hypothetical protein